MKSYFSLSWDFSSTSPGLGFGIVDFFTFFAAFKNKGARSFCLWARSINRSKKLSNESLVVFDLGILPEVSVHSAVDETVEDIVRLRR